MQSRDSSSEWGAVKDCKVGVMRRKMTAGNPVDQSTRYRETPSV
jgi:hypothetical protein